ncbi:hypothetical protein J3R83DRAFT_591 [Lanmaoa asiatica]|nr:hypothetical protein J3R83DRAFT_591 [Lanmaoa asiatica]
MSVLSTASYTTSLLLESAQVAAQFTPVPWLAPTIALLNTLISMIRQANANKNALKQLQDRCLSFLVIVQQKGDGAPPQEQQRLAAGVQSTLRDIIARLDKWYSKNKFELFIKQGDLAAAIQDCHMEINDSLTKLQLTATLDAAVWQSEFKANNERDQVEIIQYLSDIKNTQSIIAMTQHQQNTDIKAIMALMQQNLSITPNHDTQGLGTNLYQIQKSTGKLLANMHLQRGEVRRLGQYPVSGTGSMDIWEGLYLNEEKVAIKILRAVHSTPKSLQRFRREVDIWNRVWENDQGRNILPLYGFCQNDGPFPYVVSPWHPNGTADKYVARFPDVDHLALIQGVGAGVRVLHTMNPPIVHGDLKGANIIIDAVGKPLLADFGFSRVRRRHCDNPTPVLTQTHQVVEDITGVPFTQSAGVSNSQRWLAPELCFDMGRLTMAADVYAFGMTMLELMTHAMPWATVRHTTQVIIKVASGEKPPRPCDDATIARGFDDHLWKVMQNYYKATGWNEDNLYANLTRSSNAILDFNVPHGLHLSISKSPNPLFSTSYSMNAMPSLNGSMGYIFTSCELDIKNSGAVRFKDMIERFKLYSQPRRPEGKEEWLAGQRVDSRDYLLYGRLYLPSGRLDALYSTRLSPTVQALVAAISDPRSSLTGDGRARGENVSNIMFSLQHDIGKWCTEYTWSAEDGMWGVRVLHNFGRLGNSVEPSEDSSSLIGPRPKRVDEEDATGGGLKGRVSAGAEFYISAKEKSAGVSTGIRFSTLSDSSTPSSQTQSSSSSSSSPSPRGPPSQPPTTITALFNPMMGHVSAAYAAKVSRDLSLCSRFDFNVYSYDSEWTMGAEWWMRRALSQPMSDDDTSQCLDNDPSHPQQRSPHLASNVRGVVKTRISTNNTISLLWEGRLKQMLVSLGVVSDLSSRSKPIKAIGLELSYFSTG